MNDLDKKDLLELVQIIKSVANNIGSLSIDHHVFDGVKVVITK